MVRIPNKSKSRVRTALIFSANKVILWGYHLQVRSDGNSELKKVPLETDPRAALTLLIAALVVVSQPIDIVDCTLLIFPTTSLLSLSRAAAHYAERGGANN